MSHRDPAARRAYRRRWLESHREQRRMYNARYRARHSAEITARRASKADLAAARSRLWYAVNRERALARVKAYNKAHPERRRVWGRNYRARIAVPCPFCESHKHAPDTMCCPECSDKYGYLCKRNPNCGTRATHKHCPCGMPVYDVTSRHVGVEACTMCRHEMLRLGVSLSELFLLPREVDLDAAA